MDISSIGLGNTLTSQLQLQKVQGEEKDFGAVLNEAVENKDDQALKEACKEIEQYMLSSIFKQMKASTQVGESLIEKGDYEEMFEDNLVDEQCKVMCEAGGVGLADMMYKQLSNTYGVQQNYKK